MNERNTNLLALRCGIAGRFTRRPLPAVFAVARPAPPDPSPTEAAAALTHHASRITDPPLAEKPGDRIGHYKLLQQIGEGGCGVVYMVEQEEPVRRRVALKIIKLGMDTRSVINRFEAERQAVAMMDHPRERTAASLRPSDDPDRTGIDDCGATPPNRVHQTATPAARRGERMDYFQKRYPNGGWSLFSAQVLVGESLLGQKKYAGAEPLLLSGY